jgi:predicted transcriptional regulator
MTEKLIVKVLEAIRQGADTSNEIADMLGLPVANVSATISDLKQDGILRETGRWKFFREGHKGKSLCVEITKIA